MTTPTQTPTIVDEKQNFEERYLLSTLRKYPV